MKIYKIAQEYNQEILSHPDFIGFHCQRKPRSNYDDVILNSNLYAEDYYIDILEALPFQLRDKALSKNLLDKPEQYTDNFDKWAEKVHLFLKNNNIRWIFVSSNKPLIEYYGEHAYYVLLKESCVLNIFDDPYVDDIAYAYLYNANEGSPITIEIK